MAFASLDAADDNEPLAEINLVPLIDVMLVLLIIFMVTAPLLTHTVRIDLPQASSQPNQAKPDKIELAIDAAGALFWNGSSLPRSELNARLARAAQQKPQPELHLHADKTTQYQAIAEVMSAAVREGVTKIGFVTDPHTR